MTKNKILLIVLFFSLSLVIGGFFVPALKIVGTYLFILTGLYLMLLNGSFIQTRWFNLVRLAISLLLIGALFKIMHWPGADILIISSALVLIIAYLSHFFYKPRKMPIDYGKLLIVLIQPILKVFMALHVYTPAPELLDAWNMLLILFILYYVYQNHRAEFYRRNA